MLETSIYWTEIHDLWGRAAKDLLHRLTGARIGCKTAQRIIGKGLVVDYAKANGRACVYGREKRPVPFGKAVRMIAKRSWRGFLNPPHA